MSAWRSICQPIILSETSGKPPSGMNGTKATAFAAVNAPVQTRDRAARPVAGASHGKRRDYHRREFGSPTKANSKPTG